MQVPSLSKIMSLHFFALIWLNNPNETVCIHSVIIGKPSCVCVNLKWIKKNFLLYCPGYIDGKTAVSEFVHDPYGVLHGVDNMLMGKVRVCT